MVSECRQAKSVTFETTSTLPALWQAGLDEDAFSHVDFLNIVVHRRPTRLKSITSLLSCFPAVTSLSMKFDEVVVRERDSSPANMRKLQTLVLNVHQADDVMQEALGHHLLRLLLSPSSFPSVSWLSVSGLDAGIADTTLVDSLRDSVQQLLLKRIHSWRGQPTQAFTLKALERFTTLTTLNIDELTDVEYTLRQLIEEFLSQLVVMNASFTVDDVRLSAQNLEGITFPPRLDSGRFICVQLRDRQTRERITVEATDELGAAVVASSDLVDVLNRNAIAMFFITSLGQLTWDERFKTRMERMLATDSNA